MKSLINLFFAAVLAVTVVGCGSMAPKQEELVLTGVQTATVAYIIKGGAEKNLTKRAIQAVEVSSAVSAHVATITGTIDLNAVAAYANLYIQGREDISQQDKGLASFIIAKALEAARGSSITGLDVELAARIQTALAEIAKTAAGFLPPQR